MSIVLHCFCPVSWQYGTTGLPCGVHQLHQEQCVTESVHCLVSLKFDCSTITRPFVQECSPSHSFCFSSRSSVQHQFTIRVALFYWKLLLACHCEPIEISISYQNQNPIYGAQWQYYLVCLKSIIIIVCALPCSDLSGAIYVIGQPICFWMSETRIRWSIHIQLFLGIVA